jgi:hypothetical protein
MMIVIGRLWQGKVGEVKEERKKKNSSVSKYTYTACNVKREIWKGREGRDDTHYPFSPILKNSIRFLIFLFRGVSYVGFTKKGKKKKKKKTERNQRAKKTRKPESYSP